MFLGRSHERFRPFGVLFKIRNGHETFRNGNGLCFIRERSYQLMYICWWDQMKISMCEKLSKISWAVSFYYRIHLKFFLSILLMSQLHLLKFQAMLYILFYEVKIAQ